ncbi:hypothetical protein VTO73DRAFT_8917 [Trametes versicolor]
MVDNASGAIRFRKRDKWINTFNPVLTSAPDHYTDHLFKVFYWKGLILLA